MLLAPAFQLLFGLLWATHPASAQSDEFVVDTGYAKYLGNQTRENTVAYLGVPYAEPPVGDLRFRAPLELNTTRVSQEAGDEPVDSRDYPDFCIQGSIGQGDAGGAGSEDCLKVNIYAPTDASPDSDLPVLVYIHGGGYVFGNPRNWPFDHWVNQSPNVVIVSVYYRLDSLGFLATPEFADGNLGDLNAGFLDQVQALRWVQENIASFGGDPTKVTINGESAGGGSVLLHLVAKLPDERLFAGAIGQSVYRPTMPTPEQFQPLFEHYAEQAGCGEGSAEDKLSCLRQADISALARAQDSSFDGDYAAFHPTVDGKVFEVTPTVSILAGDFANVPMIIGATSNETSAGGATVGEAIQSMFPLVTDEDAEQFNDVYANSDIPEDQQVVVASGESIFRCARHIFAGAATTSWTYRYNQANPTSGSTTVSHAAENWMMFLGSNTGVNGTTTFTEMNASEEAFASELIAYWLSFVRAFDPNTYKLEKSPTWDSYQEDRARIVLQEDSEGSTEISGSFLEHENDEESDRCEFVASKAEQEQN